MIDYNDILNRNELKNKIINDVHNFESNKNDNKYKRGFYIYGNNGIGKSTFVKNILEELDYDIIQFNASNMRNKTIIENISCNNISNSSIISMFKQKKQKIAIVMDEIDGMNNGDKGGINSLITLIRNKKTKRQQEEPQSPNLIFCISTNEIDKKIGELMKVCNIYHINNPTDEQIKKLIHYKFKNIDNDIIFNLLQNDLRKLDSIYNIYLKNKNLLISPYFNKFISNKSIVENAKTVVSTLYNNNICFSKHSTIMNENDRTIVGLLWHENLSDLIDNNKPSIKLSFYQKILNNICFSDYIDRIIFQKQIWQLNELSCCIKIFYNNFILHDNNVCNIKRVNDVRFTKVLTKYSTEFNNYTFFQKIVYKFQVDKKDIIKLFFYSKNSSVIEKKITECYEISELEINRIYRYIENYIY